MDSVPLFVSVEDVLEYHAEQIYAFGGVDGVRDRALLESAVSAPLNSYLYDESANVFDLAATYAFHISQNQPFFDGNKRTALQCALGFLRGNGYQVETSAENITAWMMRLATGRMSKDELSDTLRGYSVRRHGLTEWIRRAFLGG